MARSEPLKKSLDVEAVFQDRLTQVASDIEAVLDRLLGPGAIEGELARPARLIDAMRYVALGGGKRFRPYLGGRVRLAVRRGARACADGGKRA